MKVVAKKKGKQRASHWLQLIFPPLLTYHALFCIVWMCGGSHLGDGGRLCSLMYVREAPHDQRSDDWLVKIQKA